MSFKPKPGISLWPTNRIGIFERAVEETAQGLALTVGSFPASRIEIFDLLEQVVGENDRKCARSYSGSPTVLNIPMTSRCWLIAISVNPK